MVNLLAAAALAAASPAVPTHAVALPAPDEPAMFEVHDGDTRIYLFGTFHSLDGDPRWLRTGIRSAFEQSDELVLETLLPEGPDAAQEVRAAAKAPSASSSASFLTSTRMAIDAGRSQGMQVNYGADMVLRHIAEAEGKPVHALETLQLQMNMFNHLRTAAAPKANSGQPVAGQSEQELSEAMTEMQSAWKRGDQSVFVRMLGQLDAAAPETYRIMFTERNARWADWIAARLQTPGTVFVAVGAGHFAGKDSVLVRLAQKGINSQRVY